MLRIYHSAKTVVTDFLRFCHVGVINTESQYTVSICPRTLSSITCTHKTLTRHLVSTRLLLLYIKTFKIIGSSLQELQLLGDLI